MNGTPAKSAAESRHRILLIIWGAQVFTLALFFMFTQLIKPEGPPEANQTLLLALGVAGLTTFGASFAIKAKLLAQSVVQRRPELVQNAYIVAFALCESCALFGLLAHFVTGAREALYFFVPAALGFLLHFPRRRHLEDAAGGAGFTSTM